MDDLATTVQDGAPATGKKVNAPMGPWVMRGVLLLLGLGVLIGGLRYGITVEGGHVGPGFMPFAAGLVMVLAGLWEATSAWRSRAEAGPAEEASQDEVDVFGRTARQRRMAVVKVFGILLGATVLAELIGLLLSLTVMVTVLLWWIERKKWWVALIGGAAAFLFGYLVFGVFLDVPLATGLLGLI